MGSKFKDIELGDFEADEKGCAEQALQVEPAVSTLVASAMASGVDRPTRQHLPRSDEQRRGKRVSAGLLQHGKRILERLNDVQRGQG